MKFLMPMLTEEAYVRNKKMTLIQLSHFFLLRAPGCLLHKDDFLQKEQSRERLIRLCKQNCKKKTTLFVVKKKCLASRHG